MIQNLNLDATRRKLQALAIKQAGDARITARCYNAAHHCLLLLTDDYTETQKPHLERMLSRTLHELAQ